MLYHNLNKLEKKLYDTIVKNTIDNRNIRGLVHFTTLPTDTVVTRRIVKVAKAVVADYNI